MELPPRTMILVDANELEAMAARLARIENLLERVAMKPKPEWVTVGEYADMVSKTPKTIRNWISHGRLKTRYEGKTKLIHVRDNR